MSIRYLVGIDFGHGETTASYIDLKKDEKEPAPLKIQNAGKMDDFKIPSVVYWGPVKDGSFKFSLCTNGKDTEGDEGFITPPAVYLSFKDKISKLQGFSNERQREAFFTFIRLVYQRLIKLNPFLNKDGSNFLLYIASPTKWNTEEKKDYKHFVEEAIGGRVIGWVINESDAASYKMKQDGLVLVVDFGSSTIDFTLMYGNKKINIDDCSNQRGAQKVEWLMWYKYRFAPDKDSPHGYNTIKKQGEEGKTTHRMGYINLDYWMMFLLREKKERTYTYDRSLTGAAWNDPFFKRMFSFQGCNICQMIFEEEESSEKFLGGYMQDVSDSFKQVKDVIEQNAELRSYGVGIKDMKIILSGGASRMPWVKESLKKVFVGVPIEWDPYPEYIVSDGIVKYAYALYHVRKTIAEELSKFEVWLSGQDTKLSQLISGVCREACLKRMENDQTIMKYSSEKFVDGTVEDKIPENPFQNYYKSSIKGFVMNIIYPINCSIWNNRVSINEKISKDLEKEIRKVMDDRFRDSFSRLFCIPSAQVNLGGNKNKLVLPQITGNFTIGIEKLDEITKCCTDAMSRTNTGYGNGSFIEGSYRKGRNFTNRKIIADTYFKYIKEQIFKPYPLDVVKKSALDYAVDNIIGAVEHYLAFNPCGCDLAEEIKAELGIKTISVCPSPTTPK